MHGIPLSDAAGFAAYEERVEGAILHRHLSESDYDFDYDGDDFEEEGPR